MFKNIQFYNFNFSQTSNIMFYKLLLIKQVFHKAEFLHLLRKAITLIGYSRQSNMIIRISSIISIIFFVYYICLK